MEGGQSVFRYFCVYGVCVLIECNMSPEMQETPSIYVYIENEMVSYV